MPDRLHLQPKHRKVLKALLREHLPDVEAWACGSRVNLKFQHDAGATHWFDWILKHFQRAATGNATAARPAT